MSINWTPELLAKAKRLLAELTEDIKENRVIQNAFQAQADEYQRQLYGQELRLDAYTRAVEEGTLALGGSDPFADVESLS